MYWICISVMTLCCVMDIIFCFVTIYQLYIKNYYIVITGYFKHSTIMVMIAYTLCTIGDIIHVMLDKCYFTDNCFQISSQLALEIANDATYYLGTITSETKRLCHIDIFRKQRGRCRIDKIK